MVLALLNSNTFKLKQEKHDKSNPVFYYLFTSRKSSAFFGWTSLSFSFSLFLLQSVLVFRPICTEFRAQFFLFSYSITVRADSLTYDVIYALWNEINFNAKTNVRSLFGTHSRISWKGNLLWAWNLFLRYLLCVFSAKTEKKKWKRKKRKRLSVISLIDTDNGKQN